MPHDTPLIATIVAGLGLAFIFGALANRFRIPPLVGYLIAGVLVGPNTPGFVADQSLALELAEIGVILLMFGVGLHFSLKDLLSVRAIAVPGAIVQIAFATVLGAGLAWWLGWTIGAGLVFGLALSVASTVVLLRALQERRLIETERGRIAVGWLIVEDLAMVLALVLLPALAGVLGGQTAGQPRMSGGSSRLPADFGIWGVVGVTLAKVAAFVALMLVVGRRVIPWILHYVAHTGSRELFRLAVLAIALGVAFGAAQLFGVSLALGAFFAGMIMSESELSHRAAEESLPLRDAFSVLFFVSVGMLFDPTSLIEHPWPILATLFIIVVGKSVAAFLIVVAFRHPVGTALMISASLAQIGEFSFILAELGVGLDLLPEQGRDLILAGAILSIVLNPLVFAGVDRLKPLLEKRDAKPPAGRSQAARAGDRSRRAGVLAAAGPVAKTRRERTGADQAHGPHDPDRLRPRRQPGRPVAQGAEHALPGHRGRRQDDRQPACRRRRDGRRQCRQRRGLCRRQRGRRAPADPCHPQCLRGRPDRAAGARRQPGIDIIARAHSDAEVEHLTGLGANTVIMGEREIARGIVEEVLGGKPQPPLPGDEPDAPKPPEPPTA